MKASLKELMYFYFIFQSSTSELLIKGCIDYSFFEVEKRINKGAG